MSTSSAQTEDERAESDHGSAIRLVLWTTLFVNVAVASTQIGYGYWSGIISLQADGFHTTFDALANIIGLVALGIARRPPDVEHPYGHRRMEVAASLTIGLFVVVGFVEVGRAVWTSATTDQTPSVTPAAYAIVLGTVAVNLLVSWFEHWAGRTYESMILRADALHTLSDAAASLSVLVGIYLVDSGIPVGDVLAALAVMLFIGMTAYRVLREGLEVIVDSSYLDPHLVREVVETHEAVEDCHYVRSRGMPGHVHLDLHLTLDPEMRLTEAGDVLLEVKGELHDAFPDLEDVLVQVEPHVEEHVEDVPDQLV